MALEPAATELSEEDQTFAFKVAEVALHEIFGVPEPTRKISSLERHPARSPAPSRVLKRTLKPSIRQVLERKLEACDPSNNDYSALGPCPDINAALTKLVKIVCHDFAEFAAAAAQGREKSSRWARLNQGNAFNHAVASRILTKIDTDESLCRTSRRMKAITAIAEAEMEVAYCKKISTELDNITKEEFNRGLEAYRLRRPAIPRRDEVAKIVLSDPVSRRLDSLRFAFRDFPYTENYELMVASELAAMKYGSVLSTHRTSAPQANGCTDFSQASFKNIGDRSVPTEFRKMEYAFCGSGPLPLSGILLHIFTSSPVTLIDCDEEAVRLSRHLVESLARHGVVSSKMLRFVCSDAAAVLFKRPRKSKHFTGPPQQFANRLQLKRENSVMCDVLILASLLPNETKIKVAKRARCDPEPGLVLIRSAMGLTSRLAYDEIPTNEIIKSGWAFSGALIPSRELEGATGEHVGKHEKRIRGRVRKLIGELDSTILNTVEFFC